MALAFAATASRPAAVLTGPAVIAGPPPGVTRLPRPAGTGDMTRVSITGYPLTATAALVWHGDLPRPLQQILVDTTDAAAPPPASAPPRGGGGAGAAIRRRTDQRRDSRSRGQLELMPHQALFARGDRWPRGYKRPLVATNVWATSGHLP